MKGEKLLKQPVQSGGWVEHVVKEYEKERSCLRQELSQLPEGKLRMWRGAICRITKRNGKEKRVSIQKHPEMIGKLARREYIKKALERIDHDLQYLKMLKGFPSPQEMISGMEGIYKELPPDLFASNPEYTNIASRIEKEKYLAYRRRGYSDDQIKWAGAAYFRNPYRPQDRIHFSSFGMDFRSKGECLIAENLYSEDLLFRSEELLEVDYDRHFYPDFTILRPDGKIIYWEHAGMTGDSEYMNRHYRKMMEYENAGIVPWDNLIVSYDSKDGAYDAGKISALINGWLK